MRLRGGGGRLGKMGKEKKERGRRKEREEEGEKGEGEEEGEMMERYKGEVEMGWDGMELLRGGVSEW